MGLNAAVYKQLRELPFTKEELHNITVDQTTGEIDFEDAGLFKAWRDKVRAVEKRIGNITLVHQLRTELQKVLGDSASETILLSRVLYDGTHGGDMISLGRLLQLKDEIVLTRGIAGQDISPELSRFLTDMEELILASERHKNPIVFV